MVKSRTTALETIQRFLAEANKKIGIKKVVLYGSVAKGRSRRWSDIDIAVISDNFTGMSHKERLTMLKKIAWDAGTTEIDALGYTEKEFSVDSPLDLVSEIKEYGEVVFENPEF
jgi:predicted nucleotidyltransferase